MSTALSGFDPRRFVRQAIIRAYLSLLLLGGLTAVAQSSEGKKQLDGPAQAETDSVPLELRYGEPKTYPVGTKRSIIIGDFKCGSDGTVFLPMMDDSTPLLNAAEHPGQTVDREHSAFVTALGPSGSVVRFLPGKIPGLKKFRAGATLLRISIQGLHAGNG